MCHPNSGEGRVRVKPRHFKEPLSGRSEGVVDSRRKVMSLHTVEGSFRIQVLGERGRGRRGE